MSILSPLEPVPDLPPAPRNASSLPLPEPGWGAEQGLRALLAARPLLPPLAAEVDLVSALSTVVLRAGDQAVKVYPPGTDAERLEQLRMALASVPSVVSWHAAPVATPYGVVTVMPWATAVDVVDWPTLGRLLRTFHTETTGLDLPRWTPLSRLAAQAVDLPAEHAAVLLGARAELLAALDATTSDLGVGGLHGDVSLSNALMTRDGARFIDPDWVALGPLEYDLASAVRRRQSGEIDRSTYRRFCAAYGHDVRGWEGLPLLDRIAELGALAFRLWECRRSAADLDWCAAELQAWQVAV